MHPDDQEKTAFATPNGLYEYTVLPFGLVNSPATFARLMDQVLNGLHWETCLVYLDDILVFSKTFDTHLERLQWVLDRMRDANLKLAPKKCHFFQSEVPFLGHIVNREGISTDPAKTEAIKTWPEPKNVKEVRSFLGLCSYYRRFVKGFADIAKPLHQLTEKDRIFKWDMDCQKAFDSLKGKLTSTPILAYPESEGELILDSDVSGIGMGAVLSQMQNGTEKVIAYYSKAFTHPERQYCVTRRELLAIVSAVNQFHVYLYGREVLVRTDHGALKWLLNFKNPEGQMARWLQTLGNYNLIITHRPGKLHGNADGLSRRPCENCKYCEQRENKEKQCSGLPIICRLTTGEQPKQQLPWLLTWSHEDLYKLQKEDGIIGKVLEWKEKDTKPPWCQVKHEDKILKSYWTSWNELSLEQGILHRRDPASNEVKNPQIVLPLSLRQEIMTHVHNHRVGGHFGVKKTLFNTKMRFWWPGMKSDVTRWCRRCSECQCRNPRSGARISLHQDPVGSPMERMAMDILSFKDVTDNGNTCVLVVTDYFSKWTEAFALPNHQAITVADTLVTEVFLRLGVPKIIHSDQGSEFQSDLMKEICRLLEVKQTRTCPFRPQSDGQDTYCYAFKILHRKQKWLGWPSSVCDVRIQGDTEWEHRLQSEPHNAGTRSHITYRSHVPNTSNQ